MAKDVINVDGEDKVVREDTAKYNRGNYHERRHAQ